MPDTTQSRYLHWAASKGLLKPGLTKTISQATKGFNLPTSQKVPMVKQVPTVSFNSNMKNFLKNNPKAY